MLKVFMGLGCLVTLLVGSWIVLDSNQINVTKVVSSHRAQRELNELVHGHSYVEVKEAISPYLDFIETQDDKKIYANKNNKECLYVFDTDGGMVTGLKIKGPCTTSASSPLF